MATALQTLLTTVLNANADLATIELQGTMFLKLKEEKIGAASGKVTDIYTPAVRNLVLVDDGNTMKEFADEELGDLDVLAREIVTASRLRRFEYKIPYDFDAPVAKDEEPSRPRPMAISLDFLAEAVAARKECLRQMSHAALTVKSAEERRLNLNLAKFGEFKLTSEFSERECCFDEFVTLRDEWIDGDWATVTTFADYYDWMTRTMGMVDVNGEMLPEVRVQAEKMLAAWEGRSEEDLRYWLTRNLEIHPHFYATFHNLIKETINA